MNDRKRRDFLKFTGMAIAGSTLPFSLLGSGKAVMPGGRERLRLGLIGCGGRGTGAANQALKADPDVVLHAAADIFPDRLETSVKGLEEAHGERVKINPARRFTGFDAYRKLLDAGVDVVILATPPGFRPEHLEAAVNAGKHVFCEKPVAVDAPGIRKVLEAAKTAKDKSLSIVSGFCWRYHEPKRAVFGKILDGSIGDVSAVYSTFNTGSLWSKPRQPGWNDTEFQLRNWLYYSWLSGDHIVEQAVHSIDMMSWALGNKQPVSAVATGGRQVRTDDIYGNIYDHFAVTYEFTRGIKGFHFCRQQANCANSYGVECFGAKGKAIADCSGNVHRIEGGQSWNYQGENNNMYQTQHDELFASIRNGEPVNDGIQMANSSLMAIMGRMAAYTGKKVTWEEAMNSSERLGPGQYSWDQSFPAAEVAKPGVTAFK